MPKGYRTLDGPNPVFAVRYGMSELSSISYKARTEENVKRADATIRYARHWTSPGEICTRRAVDLRKQQMLDISESSPWPIQQVVNWLAFHGVRVLNIAGNSEKTAPGIGIRAEAYFVKLFHACTADWSEAQPILTKMKP